MARIGIVGDGPGGLSAAVFLGKGGHDVTVYATDQTAMHFAHLHNYLGIPEIAGSEFQDIARSQARNHGAVVRDEEARTVAPTQGGFIVASDSGEAAYDYLILTEGKNPGLARSLGLPETEDGIAVDREYRTSLDRVYVVGRAARRKRSQAIISAGAGATAAIDILSREAGRDVQDWDTPPKE
jgi:thioredoxin reductase